MKTNSKTQSVPVLCLTIFQSESFWDLYAYSTDEMIAAKVGNHRGGKITHRKKSFAEKYTKQYRCNTPRRGRLRRFKDSSRAGKGRSEL